MTGRNRKQIDAGFLEPALSETDWEAGRLRQLHHGWLIAMNQTPVKEVIHQATSGIINVKVSQNRTSARLQTSCLLYTSDAADEP